MSHTRSSGRRVGLRRHLRVTPTPGTGVRLEDEHGVRVLRGAQVARLVPWLDGRHDRDAVLSAPHGVEPDVAARILDRLDDAGLLAEHADERSTPQRAAALAFWDATAGDALDTDARVRSCRVDVRALGRLDPAITRAVRGAFDDTGFAVADAAAQATDLTVVICTDYRDPALVELAGRLRARGRVWLPVKPVGTQVWVGPVVSPDDGPCWTCLSTRVTENRPTAPGIGHDHTPAALPAAVGLAAHAATLAALAWTTGAATTAQGRLWTCDALALDTVHHRVEARPQCSTCGDPTLVAGRARRPVTLRRRSAVPVGGGYRAADAATTLARYRHLTDPLTGVVRAARRDPRGPEFLQSFRSGSNPAGALADGGPGALRQDTGGKGVTAVDAETSALCEALERRSGTFHGDEAIEWASLRSWGDVAIDPATCVLQDPRQLVDRERWNRDHSPYQRVLEPLDDREEIAWTPLWSLSAQRHVMLPTGMLYFGGPGPAGIAADSNGCAAGASLEDAVLQGLLELVERDAVAIWWYNRTVAPGVDLDAAGDGWVDELREVHAGLGRQVWALDVSADLGVPVVVALSRRTGGPRDDVVLGCGAHPGPRVALRRALSELNQMMPPVLDLAEVADLPGPGAGPLGDDPDLVRWLRETRVDEHPYLRPDPTSAARRPTATTATCDLLTEIDGLRARIEDAGHEVLVLDQTRPDIGLPVVRVVVPGLRHFWTRFAPGRLFDVPVRLGRLPEPTPYSDLNPMPMFL